MHGLALALGKTKGSVPAPTGVPVNSSAPAVSGPQTVDETLATTNGSWTQSPSGFAYKWQSATDGAGTGAADIGGATSQTYVVGAAIATKYVRSGVLASNGLGPAAAGYQFSPWIGPIAAALSISGSPATTATTGSAYSFTPTLAGGHTAYVVDLAAGSLPSGLSLNSATGEVSGTPTTVETKTGIVLRLTDADGATKSLAAFSITVSAPGAGGQLDFSDPDAVGGLGLGLDLHVI